MPAGGRTSLREGAATGGGVTSRLHHGSPGYGMCPPPRLMHTQSQPAGQESVCQSLSLSVSLFQRRVGGAKGLRYDSV